MKFTVSLIWNLEEKGGIILRDNSLSSVAFDSSMRKIVDTLSTRVNFLTTSVSNNPNFLEIYEQELVLPSRKLDDLIALSILQWYLPPELGMLIRLELEKMKSEDQFVLELLLSTKVKMILFLQETSLFHSRELFGNILNVKHLQYLLKSLHYRRRKTKKPTRTQWKRGYRDKGSRRIDSDRHEFISYSAELKEHEYNEDTRKDTLSFLSGFLGTGG